MASPGAAVLSASPAARSKQYGPPSSDSRGDVHMRDWGHNHTERNIDIRCDENAFDLLSRAGPSITMSSLHSTPQAVGFITTEPPGLETLPDHLLAHIIQLVVAPLRAVHGAPPARAAVRAWTNLARVSTRWRALLAEEPVRLRVNTGRWPAILAWLPSARLHVAALELYLGDEGRAKSAAEREAAAEAMADLLAAPGFQRRCGRHLTQLSAWFGLDAGQLPLGEHAPCPWTALQHLSVLRVDRHSIGLLRRLPATLQSLHLEGVSDHRHEAWDAAPVQLTDALAHSQLKNLHMKRLHVSPARLPQTLQRLRLEFCTLEAREAWPAGLSVRWEGPMHQRGARSVLLLRDGGGGGGQWT